MKTISIHDAKTNLSKYIAVAKRGEDIGIGAYGKREVWLTIRDPQPARSSKIAGSLEGKQSIKTGLKTNGKAYRQLGTMRGKIWIGPDAFSSETETEVTKLMTEGDIFPDANWYPCIIVGGQSARNVK